MPSTSDEMRKIITEYFGDIDDGPPYQYLMNNGWKDNQGLLTKPGFNLDQITEKEWHCLVFLIEEWDYAYEKVG